MLPQIMPLSWFFFLLLLFLSFFSLFLMTSNFSSSLNSLSKNFFYSFKKITF